MWIPTRIDAHRRGRPREFLDRENIYFYPLTLEVHVTKLLAHYLSIWYHGGKAELGFYRYLRQPIEPFLKPENELFCAIFERGQSGQQITFVQSTLALLHV